MAKIPFLHGQRRASGATAWHWKPSPRLRKLGWANRFLGDGDGKRPPREVVDKALALNDELEQWERGDEGGGPQVADSGRLAPPKRWTFADLVDAYRASDAFAPKSKHNPDGLAEATRRGYNSRIGQLLFWAQDGTLPLAAIDKPMVVELRDALRQGSAFKAASMMRVLRLLLRWGRAHGALAHDPAEGVKIRTPPTRTVKLDWNAAQAVIARADAAGDGLASLALAVAFWSFQRREDLRGLNRMAWRTVENIDPRDRPLLANAKGEVKVFRLQQGKTGKWVDCPMPPFLHPAIEAAFERSQWLFPQPGDAEAALPAFQLQRRCRRYLDAAGFPDHQLRDFRRSGMSWAEDMGALRSDIVAISGHQVLGRATILDTYMPPDTKGACTAIATILRTQAAIAEREKAE